MTQPADKRLITEATLPGHVTATGPTKDALKAAYGRVAPAPRARGAVVFTWDDGYPHWASHTAPLATQLGQRHTFCVVSNRIGDARFGMGPTEIKTWFDAGHEIASHSATHARMGDLTTAQRKVEYDDSKAAIEAIIGAGNCTTFTYPYGSSGSARNPQSDEELRFRYERVLDTGPLGQYPMSARSPFLVDRMGWGYANQDTILQMIRLAATHPIIVVIYGHAVLEDPIPPEYLPANQPTQAQVNEAMHLAADLDVPCLTVSEAFPVGLPLMNGSFEAPATTTGQIPGWSVQNASTNDIVDVVAATPDTGLFGGKALRMKKVDNTTAALAAKQVLPVVPGKTYVFSGRVKVVTGPTNTNTGAWAARLKIEELRGTDLKAVTTAVWTTSPDVPTYGAWTSQTTAAWTCPSDVNAIQLSCGVQIGAVGQTPLPEVYFDHLAWDEAPYATTTPTIPPAAVPTHASTHLATGTDPLSLVKTEIFTAGSTTWVKATGAKSIHVLAIGPGSGGGAGARGPAGTALAGGGAGAGGGMSELTTPAAALPATVSVLIGQGGAGAPGQTVDGTAGAAGSGGVGVTQFGAYLNAGRASVAGAGGGLAAGGAGASGGGGMFTGGSGGAGSATGAAGAVPGGLASSAGGGGGGGITTGSVASAGGNGGTPNAQNSTAGTGGTAGGGAGGTGTSIVGQTASGGGGGGSSVTGAGGNGGAGGNYGAGGGGGGASLNGSVSGAGGNGANGVVIVTTYF